MKSICLANSVTLGTLLLPPEFVEICFVFSFLSDKHYWQWQGDIHARRSCTVSVLLESFRGCLKGSGSCKRFCDTNDNRS